MSAGSFAVSVTVFVRATVVADAAGDAVTTGGTRSPVGVPDGVPGTWTANASLMRAPASDRTSTSYASAGSRPAIVVVVAGAPVRTPTCVRSPVEEAVPETATTL